MARIESKPDDHRKHFTADYFSFPHRLSFFSRNPELQKQWCLARPVTGVQVALGQQITFSVLQVFSAKRRKLDLNFF